MIEPEFPNGAFDREDENDDSVFYADDRFVSHLDTTALSTVENLVGGLVEQLAGQAGAAVLDLMASWDSHIPPSAAPSRVVGLGLNRNELAQNPILTDRLIHDLNRDPSLPFGNNTFDAVLCAVSVDYLTRPVEVFRDVARVLRPGGLFLVVFSNRFFPPKVVRIWRDADDDERIRLVEGYFRRAGAFEEPRFFMSRGKPRPSDDRYAGLGVPSDPVYAVFADRKGAVSGCTRQLPESLAVNRPAVPDEPVARRRWVGATHRCPHCGEPLAKWQVPQTPFTQWSSPYQFICFNDDCPYYAGGWGALARQGNPGSYRFMYDPDSGTCHAVPVPTPGALRDSIVEAEERS